MAHSVDPIYPLLLGLVGGTVLFALVYAGTTELRAGVAEVLVTWTVCLLVYFLWKKPIISSSLPKSGVGSWITRWIVTTDHKDIGILYIVTSLYMAFVGGALAMLMRAQLAFPGQGILAASEYNQAVTAHGLVMVLWFLSPLAFGLANYIVPLQIGAKDLAFPRLNALSYWLYSLSCVLLAASFFMPGGTVNAGWTLYAPLTNSEFMPGAGPTAALLALLMLIASVTASGVNFIVTVATMRAPGVTLSRVPMFTWFVVFTVIQMVFAFPAVLGASLMLGMGRIAGTLYLSNTASGAAMLWDNLFWYFGHPEVYIVLLPAFGALAEIIPTFSARQGVYGKKVFLIATFTTVIPLSFFIWGHHMYTTVLPLLEKEVFEVGTEIISLPFGLMVFGFLWTLESGRIRLSTPMLFALGALSLFIIGGITGVFLSSIVIDQEFRGAYFVVAHFHYVMVGATLFGLFGALYYWFPRMTRRMFSEKLGKIHFLLSFVFFNLTFFPMFFLYQMPRRIFTYTVPAWAAPNLVASAGAFLFGGVQVLFVANLVYSLLSGRAAPLNPWQAVTREWLSEESSGVNPLEEVSAITAAGSGYPVLRTAEPKSTVVVSHPSDKPFILAGGLALTLGAFTLIHYFPFAPVVFVLAIVAALYGLVGWCYESVSGRFQVNEEGEGERWPFANVPRIRLAVWVFLLSEVIMFTVVLTSDTYVRLLTPDWPRIGYLHPLVPGVFSSVVLVTSSLAGFLAFVNGRSGNVKRTALWLGLAVVLGSTFVAVESSEWLQLLAQGLGPSTDNALSTYFFTTGLHMAHVLSGLLVALYLMIRVLVKGVEGTSSIEAWAIYWSFVDAVWVLIFIFFYLG
jgi:cytochrome c oxidase subunit I+III